MKPPSVYEDTMPSSHMTNKIAAIVINIGRPFSAGRWAQVGFYYGITRGVETQKPPSRRIALPGAESRG